MENNEPMSDQFGNNGNSPMPPAPNNHLVMAILTTLFCCLPLGIVAIIKANKVNSLYMSGQYEAAVVASNEAKKWSLIAVASGIVVGIVYTIVYFCVILAASQA